MNEGWEPFATDFIWSDWIWPDSGVSSCVAHKTRIVFIYLKKMVCE